MEVHMKSPSSRRASLGIALAAIAGVLAFSCSSGSGSPGGGSGSFPIVDQPLQGFIDGDSFTFVDGAAREPGSGGSPDYSFRLFSKHPSAYFEPWEWIEGAYAPMDYVYVAFDIPLAVGTYPLYIDWEGGDSRTATLGNAAKSSFLAADEGTIRIDSIDTVNHVVTGAIAARGSVDHADWVNGTFEIEYQH
jgi:hypothetical protein